MDYYAAKDQMEVLRGRFKKISREGRVNYEMFQNIMADFDRSMSKEEFLKESIDGWIDEEVFQRFAETKLK